MSTVPPILTSEPAAVAPATSAPDGAAPAPKPAAAPSRTDAIVDAWFSSTFPGTAIGGVTENWNFLHAAKEDLKRRLAAKE